MPKQVSVPFDCEKRARETLWWMNSMVNTHAKFSVFVSIPIPNEKLFCRLLITNGSLTIVLRNIKTEYRFCVATMEQQRQKKHIHLQGLQMIKSFYLFRNQGSKFDKHRFNLCIQMAVNIQLKYIYTSKIML